MRKIDYIVVHHSFTEDNHFLEDSRSITRYHVMEKGWTAIGYHFLIEYVEGILSLIPGRPVYREGAHCTHAGMNKRSIGVCLVGNYDEIPPSMEVLRYSARAVMAIMANYNVPAQHVIGHRDAGLMDGFDWRKGQFKTCPGRVFPMKTLQDMLTGTIRV